MIVVSISILTLVVVSTAFTMGPPPPPPAPPVDQVTLNKAVYSLAQGCFAVRSPATGKLLQRYKKGGLIDDGLGYIFSDVPAENAARFFFKPTSFKRYLLTDKSGRYLASHLPAEISSGTYAGAFAEWKIFAHDAGDGELVYELKATKLNRTLRHSKWNGRLYLFDLLNLANFNSESKFELVPLNDCKPFPEAEINAVKNTVPEQDQSVSDPVKGFADSHAHITAYEFMGGKMLHGAPFHKYGIESALNDSKGVHGPEGALDIIGNLMGYNDVNHRYDTRGYPDFPFWPNRRQISHQQSYYKWIERAHKAGLKVMVNYMVENEVLCNAQKTINPASWLNPNNCDPMASVELQIQRLHEMQDYIDAQEGGPGEGFFRIVTSAAEARQVIHDGKLAVLMGIEVSELFKCGLKDPESSCTEETIDMSLQYYYDAGIRVLYPIHRFDNRFGGGQLEGGFLNLGQFLSTGYFFETKECDPDVGGKHMESGFPLIGDLPVFKEILDGIGLNPTYDESRRHCNQYGLSELGEHLINRMIDIGMIIDSDHMSADATITLLDIAESRQYSGVVTSHGFTPKGPNGQVNHIQDRIAKLGGMMSIYNTSANSLNAQIKQFITLQKKYPHLVGAAFSTDVGGIATQAGSRGESAPDPVQYPFTSFDGKYTFDKQKTGNRIFDYNKEGLAHYGMLADHLEDIRNIADEEVYESVLNSAEAYIQMWERVETHTD